MNGADIVNVGTHQIKVRLFYNLIDTRRIIKALLNFVPTGHCKIDLCYHTVNAAVNRLAKLVKQVYHIGKLTLASRPYRPRRYRVRFRLNRNRAAVFIIYIYKCAKLPDSLGFLIDKKFALTDREFCYFGIVYFQRGIFCAVGLPFHKTAVTAVIIPEPIYLNF